MSLHFVLYAEADDVGHLGVGRDGHINGTVAVVFAFNERDLFRQEDFSGVPAKAATESRAAVAASRDFFIKKAPKNSRLPSKQ